MTRKVYVDMEIGRNETRYDICPRCGTDDISSSAPFRENDIIITECSCPACDINWHNVFGAPSRYQNCPHCGSADCYECGDIEYRDYNGCHADLKEPMECGTCGKFFDAWYTFECSIIDYI